MLRAGATKKNVLSEKKQNQFYSRGSVNGCVKALEKKKGWRKERW